METRSRESDDDVPPGREDIGRSTLSPSRLLPAVGRVKTAKQKRHYSEIICDCFQFPTDRSTRRASICIPTPWAAAQREEPQRKHSINER